MLELRAEVRRSWFDPVGSRMLSARVGERLAERCEGERGVALTLTYAREEWTDARECYRAARDDRHVRRFMEYLGLMLGESLAGKWVCKMEFQRDHFVHWHIILLGVNFIAHDKLTECWGFGHVWISRMTKRRVRYLAKYVAKADTLPAWLFLEPSRSVKFIRASPGFWQDTESKRSENERRQRVAGCGLSIGQACHRAQSRTQTISNHCHRRVVARPMAVLVQRAFSLGYTATAGCRGWLRLVAPSTRRARPAEGGRAPALHSTDTPNPPPEDETFPWWLVHSLRSLSDNPLDHG